MRKIVIGLAFTLLSVFLVKGQESALIKAKVNIKKNVVSINGVDVAKSEKINKEYKISSLDGTDWFIADVIMDSNGEEAERWLILKGANGNKRDAKYEMASLTFSTEKAVIDGLINSGTGIFNVDGINKEKLHEFFSKSDTTYSESIKRKGQEYKKLVENEKKEKQVEDALAAKDKLVIDAKTQDITVQGKNVLGKIEVTPIQQFGVLKGASYRVYDTNDLLVATIENAPISLNTFSNSVKVSLASGEIIKLINIEKSSAANDDYRESIKNRLVRKLYKQGYLSVEANATRKQQLGAQRAASNLQRIEEELAVTTNRYKVKGYVIDKDNNKQEGLITIEFDPIAGVNGSSNGIYNFSAKYGAKVLLDQDGKKVVYEAKDRVMFCLENGECYIGLKGQDDKGLTTDGADLLKANFWFFKVLYEKDKNYVLVRPILPTDFYLKLNKQENAVYLGDKGTILKRKADKTKKVFDAYVNCSSISFDKYDTTTEEGVKQVILDYISSCAN